MIRVIVAIVGPLLLPTAIYLAWAVFAGAARERGGVAWRAVPWVWLAGAGAVLLGIVLLRIASVGFGTPQGGVYVAPHIVDGRIVPGHLEPRAPR